MILAKCKDASDYRGIHPRLDAALACLTEDFLAKVPDVTKQLEGDALYVTRFDYETLPREETFFEAHRKYLDIHVMLSGSEQVEIATPETLTLFKESGDFRGLTGEPEQTLLLSPGDFLIVFPGDAHRIKIAAGEPAPVSKAVFKVLINE